MVIVPKGSHIKVQIQLKEIIEGLSSTGFSQIALVHTIYGRPKVNEDRAEIALPSSLWTTITSSANCGVKILRRIHIVLENLSDSGIYVLNGPHDSLLKEYDLISISPRNDSTFQATCASASIADIITLDYTTRGIRLPYRIRPADVKAAVSRCAAFEIPLAPGLLHLKQRRALLQTCRELQKSCLGMTPDILFSSGDRTFEESDVGTMAFRMPGDISNLAHAVLQFDTTTAHKAVWSNGSAIIKRAKDRKWGKSDVINVAFRHQSDDVKISSSKTKGEQSAPIKAKSSVESESEDDAIDDGFIAM